MTGAKKVMINTRMNDDILAAMEISMAKTEPGEKYNIQTQEGISRG
jgi:hypothetical protein